MAFPERKASKSLARAKDKLTAMTEIDRTREKTVNYGGDGSIFTAVEMKAQIDLCDSLLTEYNQLLKQADALGNRITDEEAKLNEYSSKVLLGAKAAFGEDANEIEQLGGTRKSERKKPVRKQQAAK